ncbi:GNAT family N-acetyltransferase [Photobacterium damselae]|uniref:GNAT family N-acetyltransferase n=1 Tax=Photobacterium damselae TaxID=38293 RepID=UPI0040697132
MLFDFSDENRQLDLDIFKSGKWLTLAVYLKGTRHQLIIAKLEFQGNKLFLGDIYIGINTERSKGLGTRLLKLVIYLAKRKRFKSIYGFASANGNRVYTFYERLGFTVISETGKLEMIIE